MATTRQKKAVKILAENGGVVSKAMLKAGYSSVSSKTPKKLTASKGFKELMAKELPTGMLLKKHRALLEKKELLIVSDGNKDGAHIENTGQPHSDVARALDMAYKLRGEYPKDTGQPTTNVIVVNVTEEGAKKYGIKTTNNETKPIPVDHL